MHVVGHGHGAWLRARHVLGMAVCIMPGQGTYKSCGYVASEITYKVVRINQVFCFFFL